MATRDLDSKFPHISISGGPEPGSVKIYRDGVEMQAVVEFQINGSMEQPVTAICKEIVTFDGSVDVFPARKLS